MKSYLKAVVLKTCRLRETQNFFEASLGMKIKECSMTHFVIYTRGIRILFVESNTETGIELYLTQKPAAGVAVREDPNQIKIITV